MTGKETITEPRFPRPRPLREEDSLGARRPHTASPRHQQSTGAAAAIGDTDVILFHSYAIVERLRRAVDARG